MKIPILSLPFGSLTVPVPTFTLTVPDAEAEFDELELDEDDEPELDEDDEPELDELPHAARARARPATTAAIAGLLNRALMVFPFWITDSNSGAT
jgi:hypothetical protein